MKRLIERLRIVRALWFRTTVEPAVSPPREWFTIERHASWSYIKTTLSLAYIERHPSEPYRDLRIGFLWTPTLRVTIGLNAGWNLVADDDQIEGFSVVSDYDRWPA